MILETILYMHEVMSGLELLASVNNERTKALPKLFRCYVDLFPSVQYKCEVYLNMYINI